MAINTDLNAAYNGFKRLSVNRDALPWIKNFDCYTGLKYEEWTTDWLQKAMDDLSIYILRPQCTYEIANHFQHFVVSLLLQAANDNYLKHHQLMCIAFSKLVPLYSDILKYSLTYFQKKPPPWISVSLNINATKRRKLSEEIEFTDLDLAESCLCFFQYRADHFRSCWDWSVFIEHSIQHEMSAVRWVVCQCAAIVSYMTEIEKNVLLNKHLTDDEIRMCILKYNCDKKNIIKLTSNDDKESDANFEDPTSGYSVNMVTKSVISIAGVALPLFSETDSQKINDSLVLVKSTLNNLRNISLGVATGKPICLTGPVGCGKTALIDYIAAVTGRIGVPNILKVQLGEETDAKMLLGGYCCSDYPGEFIWQPGALTMAVMEGHWLILEDIDSASSDVAAVLASMLETGVLSVPGFRDNISVAPGFQLFVTFRSITSFTGEHKKNTTATELLSKLWLQVTVQPLSEDELIQILQTKFPVLKSVASRLVSVFLMFSSGSHEFSQDDGSMFEDEAFDLTKLSGRLVSVRDLLKWCTRCEKEFDVSSQESALKVLQDAIDIFCCSVTDIKKRVSLAGSVAARLGIVKTKADYFINTYKPSINFSLTSCTAGRINLPIKSIVDNPVSLDLLAQTKFALTRPSCCLLERLAIAICQKEPVLLVGETGTGKTSTLQMLAKQTGNTLVVLNMNQQSDSADLLGGYKPVDMKFVLTPLREEFETLFRNFFSIEQNMKFLEHISACFNARRWTTLLHLMEHSQAAAIKRLQSTSEKERLKQWLNIGEKIYKLKLQMKQGQAALAFSFIEGTLVKALKKGYWVLLDEINLASAETLQCLSGLLEGGEGSVSLLEKGDLTSVIRNSDFRLLAAMNPATDVGKKDLPPGIRNRFTELFVDELNERTDLGLLVNCYLPDLSPSRVDAVVMFYLKVKSEAIRILADPTGHRPHFSLRTLCRALAVASKDLCSSIQRSLYEALCLSFLTQLDGPSHAIVQKLISEAAVDKGDIKSIIGQPIPEPSPKDSHLQFEGYWVVKGCVKPYVPEKYILTQCIRKNLRDVVRAVSLSNHPILIQGDTSVGKTSLITYLAQASGNKCLRINNHEHTDLQEYIGSYCVDPTNGNLVFKEGVLVEAMRQGYWIILDELNLAPSDVLEALNRVLDDNRELYIPETQETVKADTKFRLFATQNPPGLYGGRKMLSRAFRNRFVELHFDEIPPLELETILQQRCDMPPSYCKKLVSVMNELQTRRRGSAAFAGKQGFITLRDLFRWGERYRLAAQGETTKYYDWDQHIADEGYLVLAGRVRKDEERQTVIDVIKKHIKRTVDPQRLFTLNGDCSPVTRHILETVVGVPLPAAFKHVVWTYHLRCIAVLVGKAYEFHEPVLLVGETGCGKTTVAQLLAKIHNQKLLSLNCHQNSESADFLGGLRPVRDHSANDSRLFEWVDGPLVEAMKNGHVFLADELSLADDSVLERLNSLLEPERKILLSEKGTDVQEVVADENFLFISTMNPGGDFGKKELSPALRNRLTEIWCDGVTNHEDMISIIEHNVQSGLSLANQEDGTSGIGNCIVNFIDWFKTTDIGQRHIISIRDVLTWVQFINSSADWATSPSFEPVMKLPSAYVFGACVVLIDGLGTGLFGFESLTMLRNLQHECLTFLVKQMNEMTGLNLSHLANPKYIPKMTISADSFVMGPLSIQRGRYPLNEDPKYLTYAETVKRNIWKVIQSLQLPRRAILLEGSPGVGKSSLVTNLARLTGHNVTRINLSEQTDVSDLFGADLPVEGAPGGVFAWRDGLFLRALKNGNWILLDELNLASQSILESLNAVLDHRGELFIPELGRTFKLQSDQTKLFACQNPQRQGGARKGLPKSFLNRFTKVYVEPFTEKDLHFIIRCIYRTLPSTLVEKMVKFSCALEKECSMFKGGPWEMNLRDLTRWAEVIGSNPKDAGRYALLIYADRMRNEPDKRKVIDLYNKELGNDYPLIDEHGLSVTRKSVIFGDVVLPRVGTSEDSVSGAKDDSKAETLNNIIDKSSDLLILRVQIPILRSVAACIKNNWMAILIGGKGTGKTSVVRALAQVCGQKLQILAVNSAMDTSDIVGGFEQADFERRLEAVVTSAGNLLRKTVQNVLLDPRPNSVKKACILLRIWESYEAKARKCEQKLTLLAATKNFVARLAALKRVLDNLEQNKTVARLIDEVNTLQNAAGQEGGLNTGGTFEWVDSVLVKCLREGRWLLIDNANLCSPAVLDRLNGLLEPNGELVLGERGIATNGQLHSIKPHPKFRLFLTMDPHYGEISRAMRNRGVEIYMLEAEKDDVPMLDLKALLEKCGIQLSSHQDVLIELHNSIKKLTLGPEQPNVNKLIHAAALIMQHWTHGQSFRKAFKTACFDVYIKNQNFLMSYQKIKISDAINRILLSNDKKLSTFCSTLGDQINSDITTYNTQEESSFSMMQRQGALLSGIIKILCSVKENEISSGDIMLKNVFDSYLDDFKLSEFNEKLLNIKLIDVIPNLLVYFYSCVSRRNVALQNSWLKSIYDGNSLNSFSNEFIEKILNISSELELKLKEFLINSSDIISTSSSLLEQSDLPWDARRLPHKFLPKHLSYSWSTENKIIVSMNFLVQLMLNDKKGKTISSDEDMETDNMDKHVEKKTLKWQTMSVIEYSTALKDGRVSDLVADEPIISELGSLLSSLDACIFMILKSNATLLPIAEFYKLLSALEWRHRMNKIADMHLFSPSQSTGRLPQVSENVKTLLALHYKWLSKWLLPLISDLVKNNSALSSSQELQLLMRIVSDVEKSLSKCVSPLLSLAKKVRLISGQPLPLVSREEAEIALAWDKLSRDSSLLKPCLRMTDFENRVAWIVSSDGRKCRIILLKIKSLLLSGQDLKQASDLLEEAKTLLKESQLLSEQKPLVALHKKKIKPESLPQIKLWPIHDLISLKLNTAVRKHLIENASSKKNVMSLTNDVMVVDNVIDINGSNRSTVELIPKMKLNEAFCKWSEWLQTFPPGILALVMKVTGQHVIDKPIVYHQHVASVLLEQFNKSPAVKNSDVWLNWTESESNINNDEDMPQAEEYFTESKELRNILSPLLSQSVVSLVLPEATNASAMVSLRAHQDHTILLNALKTTLWRNISVLSSQQLNYLKNEEICARTSFENFTDALECSLQNKGYIVKSDEEMDVDSVQGDSVAFNRINDGLNKLIKMKESKRSWYKQLSDDDDDDPIEALPQTLLSVLSSLKELSSTTDDTEKWILIGQLWAYLGLSQLVLFSCIEVVDPVHKNALKLEYAIEEREYWERTLCIERIQCVIEGRNWFPFESSIKSKCQSLSQKEDELRSFVAVRPDPPQFSSLTKELSHVIRSLCSACNVKTILKNLITCFHQWDKELSDKILNETKMWIQSIDTFTTKFSSEYGTWYPDITTPVLVSIAQIKYGMQLMFGTVKKIAVRHKSMIPDNSIFTLDLLLSLLACYPVPQISSALQLIEFCTSDITLKLLKTASITDKDESDDVKSSERNETFRLAKFCLEEIQNIIKIKGNLKDEWSEICRILDFVVMSWEHQEEERKQKLLAEESLYVNKPKIKGENLTEEQEDELEIMQIFNSNRENDFSDIEKPVSLETVNKSKPVIDPDNKMFKLTLKDIQDIHRIHFELVHENTATHWLTPENKHEPVLNFTSPFLERFAIFKTLLNTFGEACNIDLDINVSSGLCLATDIMSLIGHCESTDEPIRGKHYDFYNDPHVAEVKQCSSLLNRLTETVEQFRMEWPDHPTLNQIMVIVNRVMSFEATSPISRFLTGLELLMAKIREWEENAHSGVSLASHMTALTQQVLAWRKLELSCWKGCLLATRNRLKGEVSKWWFYLYSLTAGFLRSKSNEIELQSASVDTPEVEVVSENDLIFALQKFMEKSTLVQFTSRLQLLYNFHCHAANLSLAGHCELTNIFWNLHQYYLQFKTVVEHHIQEMSATVEKKLKDFVKIARWNEISYWSVKENVDRNYRTLHKYIKEFEVILNEPAVSAMTKIEDSGKHNLSTSISPLNPNHYITNFVSKVSDEEKEVLEKGSILSKDISYLKKAKKLCKSIIQNTSYSRLIQTVDEFAGEIIISAQQLRDMQVDTTLPKEKQKSQAKNILQQKRKSLADLFKMLSSIGLSYRTGLVLYSSDSATSNDQFMLSPLDVTVALELIDKRPSDKDILSAWNGCEKHFWHAVARSAQLRLTSQHPHKELGPSNIERCRGFTNHLLKLAVDQKKLFNESMQSLYLLRCQSIQFNDDYENVNLNKNEEETLVQLKEELQVLLNDSVYCLEQFSVLMQTCPTEKMTLIENEIPLSSSILDESILGPMLRAFKGDSVWENMSTKLNDCIKLVKKVKAQLDKFDIYNKFMNNLLKTNPQIFNDNKIDNIIPIDYITYNEFKKIQDVISKLNKFINDLNEVKKMFDLNTNPAEKFNPFTDSFSKLTERLEMNLEHLVTLFNIYEVKTTSAMKYNKIIENANVQIYRNKIENFINKLLISIQEIYKKYKDNVDDHEKRSDVMEVDESSEQQEENAFKDNHLNKKIVKSIFDDTSKLKLKEISFEVQSLIQFLHTIQTSSEKKFCKRLLKHCGPLFDQFVLLAQFIIAHQLSALRVSSKLCSILLSLFIELTQKGFCTPEHLLDEIEGEEGGESVAGGMGLGEGEGQKDVSDQIESQDQLEEARPKGEQREEEDKECKEEDKGIEMSDDFGGKLQDVDKKDDDENDEESEKEEEPDREMGETEAGAETLDQQIWGSDSEDEADDNDQERKEEEGDRGEQIGDKEWGAQEDGKEPQAEDDKQKEQNNSDKEEKKKEINEMDDKNVDDDQIDPYHGNQQPEPEPEPLDLPEDLQLDDGEAKDQEEQNDDENPFDIDKMKEQEDPNKDEKGDAEEEQKEGEDKPDVVNLDSSDEEDNEENQGEGQNIEEKEDEKMEEDEERTGEDGGKMDEEKTGEEPKPEQEKDKDGNKDEMAKPSVDEPSVQQAESAEQSAGSKDEVAQQPEALADSKELQPEDSGVTEGPDKEGVGQAQHEQESRAGHGGSTAESVQAAQSSGLEEKRHRPGDTEEDRALGDVSEPLKKKMKTMNIEDDKREMKEQTDQEGVKEDSSADLYQHITEANIMDTDIQVLDAATKEQTEKQLVPNKEDEASDDAKDDDVVLLDDDESEADEQEPPKEKSELLPDNAKESKDGQKGNSDGKDIMEVDSKIEVEGEVVQTEGPTRGDELTFHTKWDELQDKSLKKIDLSELSKQSVQKVASWVQPTTSEEASEAWSKLSAAVSGLASELSEQLRLVLEPTTASRLRGDFRTGRRINMRKVIPYIASQFRKDKIWLRRTKPSKRDYQILLAIDDSSSMADNHSKELAFESLALVSKALTLLEVGKLGVISFGENPQVLHSLDEPFTEHNGARLLQQLLFEQQKTHIGSLVEFCSNLLVEYKGDNAQLLVVISDGRGIFNQGEEKVKAAIRRARLQGIFMVFIIVDSIQNKDSILDIRMPKFQEGKLLGISSYMDSFPFPFYLILRDINGLPLVLSDALRQWFELVANLN